jgi:hypothetical protein
MGMLPSGPYLASKKYTDTIEAPPRRNHSVDQHDRRFPLRRQRRRRSSTVAAVALAASLPQPAVRAVALPPLHSLVRAIVAAVARYCKNPDLRARPTRLSKTQKYVCQNLVMGKSYKPCRNFSARNFEVDFLRPDMAVS